MPLLLVAGLLAGCAFGDGRGFATVEGTFAVTITGAASVDAKGQPLELNAVTVQVARLQLEAEHHEPGVGTEHVTSVLPLVGSWSPLAGEQTIPFGPYEVAGAEYSRLGVVVARVVVKGKQGGQDFEVVVEPEGGMVVRANADLPANRDRLPNIALFARLEVPGDLLSGTDPSGAGAGAAAAVAKNLVDRGVVNATWERSAD